MFCHWDIGHAGARRRRLKHLASVRPPVWRMKPVPPPPPRAAHHLASLGGESSKPKPETKVGLRSAVFGGVNTVRSCSNLEDGRVKSGTMDGHGLMTTKIGALQRRAVRVGAPVACRAGRIRSSCQLASPRNSRAWLDRSSAFTQPGALGLVRLPVSGRAARQSCPPRANPA
jgi:hypothetical protein